MELYLNPTYKLKIFRDADEVGIKEKTHYLHIDAPS